MASTTVVQTGADASDAEVVRRVLAGERALFEVLMRRYNQRVYRAIRSILRDEQDAEDAMQQAYLQAYAHLGEFEGASAFSTWLTRIAINEALACHRKCSRLDLVDELPDIAEDDMRSPPKSPEDRAVSQESLRLLELAVDKLPPTYRTAFMLREVEQLSTAETAASMGITEEAVKVRLHRARLSLRDALAEVVGQSPPQAFSFLAPRCNRVVATVMAAIERGEVRISVSTHSA
jgi:RNA polymerase sigma-70 factor (ECF subfamily)